MFCDCRQLLLPGRYEEFNKTEDKGVGLDFWPLCCSRGFIMRVRATSRPVPACYLAWRDGLNDTDANNKRMAHALGLSIVYSTCQESDDFSIAHMYV